MTTTDRFDLPLLRELTSVPAVSGHEDRMIGYLQEWVSRFVDDVTVDGIGNVIARMPGPEDSPRVMVFAHMDHVGLAVRKLGDDGFVRVDRIGGINRKALPARPVSVQTRRGPVPGSIGVMAHHLTPEAERYTVPDVRSLYVDVGARSRAELDDLDIRVGDSIAFDNPFAVMNDRFVRAAALDDRIGCYVLLKIVERLAGTRLPCSLYATFTVQEEFNVRGSEPAARAIRPHAAVCVDMTQASDPPDLRDENDVRLGAGPTLRLMSFHGRGTLGGLIPNPRLADVVEKTGDRLGIGLQRAAATGGLTDASFLQLLHDGIPSVDLGVPALYSHSPIEMVHMRDVEQTIELVCGIVRALDGDVDLGRGVPWTETR